MVFGVVGINELFWIYHKVCHFDEGEIALGNR